MKYYATFKSDPFTEKCLIYAILPKKKDVNQVYLYKFLWILFESCNGLKNLHLSKTKKCISGKISYIKQASDFRQTHESHTCWFTHFLCLTWYHPTTFHLNKEKWIQGHWSQWKQFYYFRNFLFEAPRSKWCLMLSKQGLVTVQTIYSQFHLPVQDSTKASVKLQYLKTMNLGKYQ